MQHLKSVGNVPLFTFKTEGVDKITAYLKQGTHAQKIGSCKNDGIDRNFIFGVQLEVLGLCDLLWTCVLGNHPRCLEDREEPLGHRYHFWLGDG